MPRHTFRFPNHIREAVKAHIRKAASCLDPDRYRQEPARVAALASRIEGSAYDAPDGFVRFTCTVVSDRGPGSAEKFSGADLAITALIRNPHHCIEKAILVQAKNGIPALDTQKGRDLAQQVISMKKLTRSPKILDLSPFGIFGLPSMISGNLYIADEGPIATPLEDYFVRRILTTLDGDTRPHFTDGVKESNLTTLRVDATLVDAL
jgi:hypothetical protein